MRESLVAWQLRVPQIRTSWDPLRGAFQQYQARYVTTSLREFSDMFLFLDPRQLVVLNVAAMVSLAILGSWIGGPLLCAGAGALGFFAPAVGVRLYRRRRRSSFDSQLSDALQQMANALRAGLTALGGLLVSR